jgi:hypothetical protein
MAVQKQNRVVALPSKQNQRIDKPSNRLVTLKQSEEWNQLSRTVQHKYVANDTRLSALVHIKSRNGEAIDDLRSDSIGRIRGTLGEWQDLIDELHESCGDEIRDALTMQKTNEIATHLTSHQAGLDALNEQLATELQDLMTQPDTDLVKPTWEDKLDDAFSFDEAELKRRGYPPLSFWESVLNIPTLGLVAQKRLREYERARLGVPSAHLSDDEEEGVVLDADWSPK